MPFRKGEGERDVYVDSFMDFAGLSIYFKSEVRKDGVI